MPDAFSYDAFLSHSSKDKAVVRDVAERLRKDGLKVWFDEWMLREQDSGEPTTRQAKIEEGLGTVGGGHMWEGNLPFRDPLNKECRLFPLRLDDIDGNNSTET